jgi:hypothetical protein
VIKIEKVISLTQPWATLMAVGVKEIETRGWRTSHRGWLGIHATRECDKSFRINGAASDLAMAGFYDALPQSGLVGAVCLVDIWRTEDLLVYWRSRRRHGVGLYSDEREQRYGNYEPDRYGWITRTPRMLKEPIPMRGHQSIWKLPHGGIELPESAFVPNNGGLNHTC